MRNRCIAVILCLLYLSVGTVFAALHDHERESAQSQHQCTACAWHHGSKIDVPKVAPFIERPETYVVVVCLERVTYFQVVLRVHPSRGPPALPL